MAVGVKPPYRSAIAATDPSFQDLVERIYVEMTAHRGEPRPTARVEHFPGTGISTILPHVSTNLLSGLIEAVAAAPYNGKADLPDIAASLHMEIDDLFPVGRDTADAALG